MRTLIGKLNDAIDVKRFYFKGKINVDCPVCKSQLARDFERDYLSYPQIGEPDTLGFYCTKCEKEFEMPFVLKSVDIVIEYDNENMKEA